MKAGEALTEAAARLDAAGVANPRREARLLLNLALGVDANALVAPDRVIGAVESQNLLALVTRRAGREPYARIAGRREFWSLPFRLSPDTLEPRPDSEAVIEAALARLSDRAAALHIVDFGTGTGALLLALLSALPNARGVGVDLAAGAVETARQNAAALGFADRARFVRGNWGGGLDVPADVILANPPYLSSADRSRLAPEVAGFDPPLALDGGPDGLRAYREMAPDIGRLLKPTGFAACEIGMGQGDDVARIMSRAGLELVAKRCDLADIERCLVFEQRKTLVNRKIKA